MTKSFLISENGLVLIQTSGGVMGALTQLDAANVEDTVCLYARTTTFLRKFCTVGNFREAKSAVLNAFKTEDEIN
jgi:hypothetical protein